jgi:hypothetical protein
MAQTIGTRSTLQVINESRGVRDVSDKIWFLEPNAQPLLTFLSGLNKKRASENTKYEWYDDDYVARWAQTTGTTYSATNTSIVVTDATLFRAGDLVAVPNAVSSSTAPQIMHVTAVDVGTNTLTVVRNVGSAGAAQIDASSALTFAGSAFAEGAAFPTMKSTNPVGSFNYTQIFRTPIIITGTNMASKTYGQADLDLLRFKKAAEHKIDINRAFLFGRKQEDTSTYSTPIRFTEGLFSKISTNVTNANGTLTQLGLETFARQAFRYGKDKKILLASPLVCSAINQFAKSHMTMSPGEKKYGVSTKTIITAHGEWILVKDWMLEDGVSGKNGFGGNAFSLDLDSISMRFLSSNGVSRDTKYLTDSVQDGSDKRSDEYLTEIGLQINNEKHHARLYNVTGFSN